ncbi:MAG: hypothetical protein IJ279_02190 [Clostridia bacterium]|nr:hypothetical protein [Clostridia bacterium]
MKKISKVISIFMAAVLALSVFAVSTSAIATELTAGNTKETATNIPSFGTEYTSTLSKAGEQDWFKFTTLSEDAYYTIALENYNIPGHGVGEFGATLYVYDEYNKQIVYNNSQNRPNSTVQLEKNMTYYIKVVAASGNPTSTGNYEILISYKLDPVSNVREEATKININNDYTHSLDGTGDTDWFKFTTLSEDAYYTIALENYNIPGHGVGEFGVNLYVYDEYNKQIVYNNSQNRPNSTVQLEKNMTYYIKVVAASGNPTSTGNYGFSIKCDTAVEPDESTKPENPGDNTNGTGFDFMSILTAIWNFFVGIFNFIIGLFA